MDFYCDNQAFSAVFGNYKEGRPRTLEAAPPSIAHIMENGDMCAPKGPRAHTMSPPLQG
jgi:hypothetical protein